MLDVKFLEEIIPNIDKWTYGDLKKIKLMEEKEMTDIIDCWNRHYSMDVIANIIKIEDVLRLCITAMYYMKRTKTISIDGSGLKVSRVFDDSPYVYEEYSIKEDEKILTKRQSELKCDMCYYDDQINSGECHACIKGNRDNFVPKSL